MSPSQAGGPSQTKGESSAARFGKQLLAVFVLIIAAWIIIKIFAGIVGFLFFPILAIGAIVALVWAIRVLF
jgi:H+/Cl- antiporter ClcA